MTKRADQESSADTHCCQAAAALPINGESRHADRQTGLKRRNPRQIAARTEAVSEHHIVRVVIDAQRAQILRHGVRAWRRPSRPQSASPVHVPPYRSASAAPRRWPRQSLVNHHVCPLRSTQRARTVRSTLPAAVSGSSARCTQRRGRNGPARLVRAWRASLPRSSISVQTATTTEPSRSCGCGYDDRPHRGLQAAGPPRHRRRAPSRLQSG